jgi:hypothetical protein
MAEPGRAYLAARNAARNGEGPRGRSVDPRAYELAEQVLNGLEYSERAPLARRCAHRTARGARRPTIRAVTVRAADLLAAATLRGRNSNPDGSAR